MAVDGSRLRVEMSGERMDNPALMQESLGVSFAYLLSHMRGLRGCHSILSPNLQFTIVPLALLSGKTQIRASPSVCQILLDKSCDLPTSKIICQVKKQCISKSLTFLTW